MANNTGTIDIDMYVLLERIKKITKDNLELIKEIKTLKGEPLEIPRDPEDPKSYDPILMTELDVKQRDAELLNALLRDV